MNIRPIAAIIISLVIFTASPGTVAVSTVQASAFFVPPEKKVSEVRPYLASLPPAKLVSAPKKIIGNDGRESLGVKTTASHVYVVDEKSNAVLFSNAEHERVPLASITKLMTARVFRSRGIDWNMVVTMDNVVPDGGVAYFANGDQVTVRDLWKTMLVGSSNTAARTLQKVSGLSEDEFVAEMNASAAGLGMFDTHFVEPTGLDEKNLSSAADIALLSRVAFADVEVTNVVSLVYFDLTKIKGSPKRVLSTNKLLGSFIAKAPYKLIGAKTGYITESGYNIVVSVTRTNASPVTVVVLGASSNDLRFQEAKSVAYWAFNNYSWGAGRLSVASK